MKDYCIILILRVFKIVMLKITFRGNKMKKFGLVFILAVLCFNVLAVATSSKSLTDSLIAYYPFNSNLNDISGNGYNGTGYYNVAYSTDRYGNNDSTFLSDGVSSYFTIPINQTILDTNFTISFWSNIDNKEHHSIFVYYNNDNDNGYKVHLVAESGDLFLHLRDIGDAEYTTIDLPAINFNKWENLLFSYDNGLWKYYVNGEYVQEFTKTISELTFSKIIWCTHEPINYSYCLEGKIDDVSVYNRTLSDDEVLQLYANYLPPENFTAVAENGYNKLAWGTSEYQRLQKVKVYRNGAFLSDIIMDGQEDSLYTDTEVIHDSTYQYCITSVDTLGNESIKSNIIPVTGFILFTDIDAGITGVHYSDAAWGDYDSDGDLDILFNGYDTDQASEIYRNDAGSFVNIGANIQGLHSGSLDWGDYDNDGDLDILITGHSGVGDNYISKIYQNDSGTFNDISAGLTGVVLSMGSSWGDYDNDGDLDIIISGRTPTLSLITKIYRNDSGIFTDINAGLTGVYYSSVAWGDYDNDGDLDILLTGNNGTSDVSRIYRNDVGSFSDISAGLTGVHRSYATWGDYDADGDLDVMIAGYDGSTQITKIYNNNSGIFTEFSAGLMGIEYGSVEWGDWDNDGDLDILIIGVNNVTEVYEYNSGSYSSIATNLPKITQQGVAKWGDYDNDNDLDILITGNTAAGSIVKIYRNNSLTANSIPNSPSNLEFSQDQYELNFSFDPATDPETPSEGLTYNIDINIEDGTVKTASSDYTTGYKRLASMGNIQQNTSWTLEIEAPEETIPQQLFDLNWKVQAVDNCFTGSEFASKNDTVMNRDLITVPKETMIASDALMWEYVMPSDSISSYTLQLSNDSLFTDCFETYFPTAKDNKTVYFGIDLQSLGILDSLENNGRYFWRVKPEHINPVISTGFKLVSDTFIYNPTYSAPSPVDINVVGEFVTLSWNTTKDAEKGEIYNVYSTNNPYAIFPDEWSFEVTLSTNQWITMTSELKKFYCVTATSGEK